MARSFTSQDTQNIIRRHTELRSKISSIKKMYISSKNDVVQYAEDLEYGKTFERIVHYELANGTPKVEPSIISLLNQLETYDKAKQINSELERIEQQYSGEINEGIRLLSATATNGFKWFFSSNANKAQSEQVYNRLKELLEGNYRKKIEDLHIRTDRLLDENQAQIADTMLDYYWTVFQSVCSDMCSNDSISEDISLLVNRYSALSKQGAELGMIADNRKKEVKKAVDRMIALELLETLRGIPVEELNREGSNFRIKALSDHGFTTMADVYSARTYQLSSVYGVSETAANGMKVVAAKYAERIKPDIRIRLSADNRTPEATKAVQAIYRYRETDNILHQIVKIQRKYKPIIIEMMKSLKTADGIIRWHFNGHQRKEKWISAYQSLSQVLEGEYGNSLENLFAEIQSKKLVQDNAAWNDFSLNSIQYFTILEELVPGALGNNDGLYGLPEELAQEIQDECFFPDGLNCSLRRYQEWGVKYVLHQGKVLLGDEMGLGKTVQAIATMVSLKNTGATHFMVVCPASVLPNWCKEIASKSKLRVTKIHGSERDAAFREWMKAGGAAVTTFETTGCCGMDEDFKFDLLIVDEAHYIKNPEARRTVNLKKLCIHAARELFMTGTALENNVDEMIELISILQPQIAADVRNIAFMSAAPQFRKRIAPVYYRRKRTDVLSELPELIESKEWCAMTAVEEAEYEKSVLEKNYAASRRVSWNVSDLKHSSKAKRLTELVEMAAEDNRKVIVFSFFLDTIRMVRELLGDRCVQAINGSVSAQRRQEIIDDFDQAPGGTVLPAQIQSGGTGLNIQSASVVIFCEPQLKPSIENQAVSRAYRMGQSRNVLVYRLLCENSLDERIMGILAQKQAIFDAFADKSVAAAETLEIDNSTLGDIIKEEIERINAKKGGSSGKATETS